MNSDAALAEMKTMLTELKADFKAELKSEMKSLRVEMRNGFERLEEKVTTLRTNETIKKIDSRLEEVECRISTAEDQNAVAERLLSFLLQSNQYLREMPRFRKELRGATT